MASWWSSPSAPHPQYALASLLLLLIVLLAGCTATTDDPAGPDPTDDGIPPTPSPGDATAVPRWALGEHWTYTPTEGEPATFVVIDQTATDWIIGTNARDLAFFHAQEEVSTLGAQRKTDLAGSQGTERIQFFQWPLTDGATWTTPWDGTERTITATAEDDDTWSFEAREGDNTTVRYTYDPAVRWFTTLEFFTDDGTPAFGWTLDTHGTNWTGETYTWDLQSVLEFAESSTFAYSAQPKTFEVPAEATDVWATLQVGCTTGIITTGIHPVPWDAGAAGRRWNEGCTGPWGFTGTLGHVAGTWNADFAWHDTEQGPVSATVYVRTLHTVPIG